MLNLTSSGLLLAQPSVAGLANVRTSMPFGSVAFLWRYCGAFPAQFPSPNEKRHADVAGEILKLPSLLALNPSYPSGPHRFADREYFVVVYETDPEALDESAWPSCSSKHVGQRTGGHPMGHDAEDYRPGNRRGECLAAR
jgi:hypothetical protein